MKTLTKLTLISAALLAVGCSTKEKRTKWTDPVMRVMIDPDTIDTHNYVRITNALIKNGKFIVIDRGAGYLAARKEQERLHLDKVDRFDDKEKYAHWKKLYGVGGIVIAHSQCQRASSMFRNFYLKCLNSLAIVDSTTGEVITTAEGISEVQNDVPEWHEVVGELADTYPKNYEVSKDSERLLEYKDISKEEAIRAREITSAAGPK